MMYPVVSQVIVVYGAVYLTEKLISYTAYQSVCYSAVFVKNCVVSGFYYLTTKKESKEFKDINDNLDDTKGPVMVC
jgi:hypothetical protein